MASINERNLYLRWEKRLKVKINRLANKPKITSLENYNLFDASMLPKQEDIARRDQYKLVQRYYSVYLHQDMLGNWMLTKINGGIGTARGKVVSQYCATYEAGLQLIEKLKKIRKSHHYELILINTEGITK